MTLEVLLSFLHIKSVHFLSIEEHIPRLVVTDTCGFCREQVVVEHSLIWSYMIDER